MPTIDLCFRLQGHHLPADHGYALYAAVTSVLPALHGSNRPADGSPNGLSRLAIAPIRGTVIGNRMLALQPDSRLVLRVDSDRIGEMLSLAGKRLSIDGYDVFVGVPEVRPLTPAARLYSRLVTIKGFLEPGPFLEAVRRQLEALGIKGSPAIPVRRGQQSLEGQNSSESATTPYVRRTLRIRDKEVVGFALEVSQLTAEESLRLQEAGLGGRRLLGCGYFVRGK